MYQDIDHYEIIFKLWKHVKSEVWNVQIYALMLVCGFQDRLQYFLTGDATAREYFYVNRDTAEIILIKNLDTTAVKTFNVGINSV